MKLLIVVPDKKAISVRKVLAGMGVTVEEAVEALVAQDNDSYVQKALKEVQAQVKEVDVLNTELKALNETLTSDKSTLEEKISVIESEKAQLNKESESAQEAINKLQVENLELKDKLKKAKAK